MLSYKLYTETCERTNCWIYDGLSSPIHARKYDVEYNKNVVTLFFVLAKKKEVGI